MKGVSKVVHVARPDERPWNPGFLDVVRDLLRARDVGWATAERLPATPEPDTIYLLHGGRDATRDVAAFEAARGEVSPAVAARTIIDVADRRGCLDILMRWRFPAALEDERREPIGRCEVFRALFSGEEPGAIEVLAGDQITTDYAYLTSASDAPPGTKAERLVAIVEAVGGL